MSKSKCLFCKRKGHWKKDAYKLLAHKEKKQNQSLQQETNNLKQVNSMEASDRVQHLFAIMEQNNDGWLVVDSGATNH